MTHQSPEGNDPHGRAAMLLVESLLHGLVARSLITVAEAIEIVVTASEVATELADEATLVAARDTTARTLLDSIGTSLSPDMPREPG